MPSNLLSTISTFVSNGLAKSTFTTDATPIDQMTPAQVVLFIIVFLLALFIVMAIGTYFFNNVLVKVFSNARKVTVIEFLGLYITLQILCN